MIKKPLYKKRKKRSRMSIDTTELTTYIQSVLDALRKSQGNGFYLQTPIEFEVAVITTKEVKGGLKIFVADMSGVSQKEAISKIKFKYSA